jgi:hypothetical protein
LESCPAGGASHDLDDGVVVGAQDPLFLSEGAHADLVLVDEWMSWATTSTIGSSNSLRTRNLSLVILSQEKSQSSESATVPSSRSAIKVSRRALRTQSWMLG